MSKSHNGRCTSRMTLATLYDAAKLGSARGANDGTDRQFRYGKSIRPSVVR